MELYCVEARRGAGPVVVGETAGSAWLTRPAQTGFGEPSMLLKAHTLEFESQHVIENTLVTIGADGGRLGALNVRRPQRTERIGIMQNLSNEPVKLLKTKLPFSETRQLAEKALLILEKPSSY